MARQQGSWFDQFDQPQPQQASGGGGSSWFDQFSTVTPAPSVAVDIEEPPSLTGRVGSFLTRAGHILGSTGDATATTIDQLVNKKAGLGEALGAGFDAFKDTTSTTTDFDKVLANAGMEDGWTRAGLGFVGDVLVDPINLIGGVPVKMASKAGVKLPSLLAKAAGGSNELVGATSRMLKTAGTNIEEIPVVRDLLDKVVQYRGLGKVPSQIDKDFTARDFFRLGDSRGRHAGEESAEWVARIAPDITEAEAKEIAFALDEGVKLADPRLQRVAGLMRKRLDHQVTADTALGSLNSKITTRPNYVPRYPGKFDNTNPAIRAVRRGKVANDTLAPLPGGSIPKTLREAHEQQGAVADIREIVAKRTAEGQAANRSIELMQDAVKHFGINKVKDGYRTLNLNRLRREFHAPILDTFKNVHFPERVAKELERAVVLSSKETDASKLVNSAGKLWKTLALTSPGHQFTNFLGNISNMHLGGMSMPEIAHYYTKGVKWAKELGDPRGFKVPKFGTEVVNQAGEKGIGKYSNYEIAKALKEYEIIGTATQLGELEQARDALPLFKGDWNPLNSDMKIFKFARKGGQRYVEEPARTAFFVNEVRKGKTLEQAALRTKEILFDYGELTDAEKKLKLYAIPFYTWTRKNLPLQMKSMLTAPERLDRHKDVLQFFQNAGDGDDFTQPEYLSESGYVPSPIQGEDGTPAMMRMALPMQDLGLVPSELSWEALQESGRRFAGMAAPWAKMPVELTTNQEIQSGIPIRRSTGVGTPSALARGLRAAAGVIGAEPAVDWFADLRETPMGLKQGDTNSYFWRQIPGFTWMANAVPGVREDDPITQDKLPALYQLLGTIAGLNPRLINLQTEQSEMENRMSEWEQRVKRSLEP